MLSMFSRTLPVVALALCVISGITAVPAVVIDSSALSAKQSSKTPKSQPKASVPKSPKIDPKSGCANNCASSLRFANPAAKRYEVTNDIPSNTFRTHTSWAGEMSISSTNKDTFFFWLWGAEDKGSKDDTVIWLNGGPGCSSLIGFLEENGPISYNPTMSSPRPNPYSWTKAANILWVEQPSGVGFAELDPKAPPIQSEADIAAGFSGFLDNMKQTFPELFAPGRRLWIAAESYGGVYGPYIAEKIYRDGNQFNLHGIMLVDGLFSDYALQTDVTSWDYLQHFDDIFRMKKADRDLVKQFSDQCKYTSYTEDNLHYPSRGPLPTFSENGCHTYDALIRGAQRANSAFNTYRITDRKNLTDVLSPVNETTPTWYDNRALQDAIHANHTKWDECSYPFGGNYDQSPQPDANGVLTYVIDSAPSKRNVIVHGALDGRLLLNGTLLALQNLTWSSHRGFDQPINIPLIDTEGKTAGTYRTQGSLTAAIALKAGHMVPSPQDAPAAGLALIKYLIGTGKLS